MSDSFQSDSFQPDSFQPAGQLPHQTAPEGSAAARFGSNLWDGTIGALGSAGKVLQSIVLPGSQTFTPETIAKAKQIIDSHVDQWNKAKQAYDRGQYTEAAGHGLATVLPMIGPAAAAAGEKMGGTDPTMNKYGTVTQSGKAPDIAGGLGAATALLAPYAIAPAIKLAGKAVAPLSQAAEATGLPDALRSSAETEYGRVLNATTKGNKLRSAKIVPELIDRGVMAPTLNSLRNKAAANIQTSGQAIGDAFDNLPEGSSISLKNVQAHLESAISEHTAVGPGGEVMPMSPVADTAISHIQDLSKRLQDYATADATTGELSIPVDTARRLRQYYDDVAAAAGRYDGKSLSEISQAKAHGMAADAIRAEFGKDYPDIAAANKEYSFWKDVHRVTDDTLIRRQGQAKPLGQKLAGAAAIAAASPGGIHGMILAKGAMETLVNVTSSPAWRTVSAVLKDRLADAIASGATGPAGVIVGKIAAQARQQEIAPTPPTLPPPEPATLVPNAEPIASPAGPVARPAGESGPLPQADSSAIAPASETRITVPGQTRSYGASYQVKELGDIQTSHSGHTFQPNTKYALSNDRNYNNPANQEKVVNWSTPAQFDPSYHITDNGDALNGPIVTDSAGNALGGNGRGMILQRVYANNPKGAAAYRELLTKKAAQFGIDPAQIAGMKQPVLTRVINDSEFSNGGKGNAITDFNKSGSAALTPAERSIADSRRVSSGTLEDVAGRLESKGPDSTLAQVLEGKSGSQVLEKLISDGVVSPQERAAFATEEGLTKAGKDRISSLMLGRFFKDPAQLDRIPATIRNKVERIAAPLARAESYPGWSLTENVQQAMDILEQADAAKATSIDDFLRQDGLFGTQKYSPKAVELARQFKSLPTAKLLAAIRQYSQDAQHAAGGPTMFGEPPTPGQSFVDAFKPAAGVGSKLRSSSK